MSECLTAALPLASCLCMGGIGRQTSFRSNQDFFGCPCFDGQGLANDMPGCKYCHSRMHVPASIPSSRDSARALLQSRMTAFPRAADPSAAKPCFHIASPVETAFGGVSSPFKLGLRSHRFLVCLNLARAGNKPPASCIQSSRHNLYVFDQQHQPGLPGSIASPQRFGLGAGSLLPLQSLCISSASRCRLCSAHTHTNPRTTPAYNLISHHHGSSGDAADGADGGLDDEPV